MIKLKCFEILEIGFLLDLSSYFRKNYDFAFDDRKYLRNPLDRQKHKFDTCVKKKKSYLNNLCEKSPLPELT